MSNKYDDLFNFYIKLYDHETARFKELEGKIVRYFSAYSLLIALAGTVGLNLKFFFENKELPWLVGNYICLVLVLLFLIISWCYLFSALKPKNLQRFAYNNSVIELFSYNNPVHIKYQLSQRAKELIEHNAKVSDKKAEKIEKAYKWSIPALILFIASLFLATLNVYEVDLTRLGGYLINLCHQHIHLIRLN